MADLLAKQDTALTFLTRGQEVDGTVVAINDNEITLDLGTKAEGVIYRKDLTEDQEKDLKIGAKVKAFVIIPENESGQALLTIQKAGGRVSGGPKWLKFEQAIGKETTFIGRGIEVNKGGLIIEANGVRGFLPSSQVALAQAANLEEMVGKDIEVTVIEVEPTQNRLIFSQKSKVNDKTKEVIGKLKVGDKVKGKVAAVLQFGIFVTLEEGVEGLVHVSEISWERSDSAAEAYKVGDEVEAIVISTDVNTGRVNLSIRNLTTDPFADVTKDFQPDDVIKGKVSKVNSQGVYIELKGGIEGFVPASKLDAGTDYEAGASYNFLVDNVDSNKRRINLAPFLTSMDGLIYK